MLTRSSLEYKGRGKIFSKKSIKDHKKRKAVKRKGENGEKLT